MTFRLRVITVLLILLFAGLVSRLFFWQIIKGRELSFLATSQTKGREYISAPRGSILASDGSWLAARSMSWLLVANPQEIKNREGVSEKLSPFFVRERKIENREEYRKDLLVEIERINGLLGRTESVWVPIKHKVTDNTKKEIENLEIRGLSFEPEEARVYPEASVAAHLLGFVGKNEKGEDLGYFGLEGYYDLTLSGKEGFIAQEFDARGTPILIDNAEEVSAIQGVDLITHIDKSIQVAVEENLRDGIEMYGALAGTAIVMDPSNGAVLAMSSFPAYDPATYFEFGNSFFKNPSTSDVFEPGSIFKVLIMASALDADVIKPDTKCDICDKALKIDKFTIETWNDEYRRDATMTEVIVHSDNVGMTFVGEKLGREKMREYLEKFGIGKRTKVDLQGETTGLLKEKKDWTIVDTATISFGQGVSVTPMQMVSAVSAIAGKGKLYRPQIVDKLRGEDWEQDIKPILEANPISKEAAEEITAMMVEAAANGEAKWTHKDGFGVAGKTGTAQIPIAGHYDEEKTIASFVGFAPYDDPKFVMIVTLREPQTSPWASETAAPLWYSIAEQLFVYMGIQPEG